MNTSNCRLTRYIQISLIFLALLIVNNDVFGMQRIWSPLCMNENPIIPGNIFNIANPEGLWEFMMHDWVTKISNKTISYDPSVHPMSKIVIGEAGECYSLLFASNRTKRPMPQVKRTFGRVDRHRQSTFSDRDLSVEERRFITEELIPREFVEICDGCYHWLLSRCDQVFFDEEAAHISKAEIDLIIALWKKTGAEFNPFQSYFAYARYIFGYIKSELSNRMYCILENAFPIYSPHFLITSTIPDKPQCIADVNELYDLLDLQKYMSHIPNKNIQIHFNSNNAGDTLGGASVSVWHCQVADLGLGNPSHWAIDILKQYGDVLIGKYKHLMTTHRLFISNNQINVCRAAFAYISILHKNNNAYNVSFFVDTDSNFIILVTIRGNWFEKNAGLAFQHSDNPAFAEVSGSFIFTNPEEYELIKAKQLEEIKNIIDLWHQAASQEMSIVASFDQKFDEAYIGH
ncbi:MAG: hypothetical protein US49_C0008G0001 [candidate division TM6 bacterium GW2011_GWF2_37_49]|nr:MAG: hypothetical protein US49_C0008G0001 [candidate division TM6 bacterium GW2011_GWF2_37_49]